MCGLPQGTVFGPALYKKIIDRLKCSCSRVLLLNILKKRLFFKNLLTNLLHLNAN